MLSDHAIMHDLQVAIDSVFLPNNFPAIFSQDPNGVGFYLQESCGDRFTASIVAATRIDGPGLAVMVFQTPMVPNLKKLAGRLQLRFGPARTAFIRREDGLYANISTPREQALKGVRPRVELFE